jgi:hypothetical protein
MATNLLQRREHRKLNKVRSAIWNSFLSKQRSKRFNPVYCITHHRRLFKQNKSTWFCAKCISLAFAVFSVMPNSLYVLRCSQISSVLKRYFIKHQRVQNLKFFYGLILRKVFSSFVGGCSAFYRKQVFFKNVLFIRRLKKTMRLRSSLVSALESRLASVIWRGFFTASIVSAQQLIVFGCVKVIGVFTTKASFLLSSGNNVTLINSSWFVDEFILRYDVWFRLPFRIPLPHLEVSFAICTIIFLYKPFDVESRFSFSPKLLFVRSFYL